MQLTEAIKQPRRSHVSQAGNFDAAKFLETAGPGRAALQVKPKQTIYAQGSAGNAVYYIQSGQVRLTVVSEHGREGVTAILGPGEFFGEACLASPSIYTASATAITKTSVVRIEKHTMLRVLQEDPALSSLFLTFLLSRNRQIETDLLDHLFNSSEQRLARLLLMLAQHHKDDGPVSVIPKISQDILAARVGTTRSRINFFMNKFRRLGYIEYNTGGTDAGLKVSASLMDVILHE